MYAVGRAAPRGRRPSILLELLILAALVLASGMLAGVEIAIIALRRGQIAELVARGHRGAMAVESLRNDPERFLATIQIGMTVLGTTAAAWAGHTFTRQIAAAVATIPAIAPYADPLALAVVIVVLSYLMLVFGELVPKSAALRAATSYSLLFGRTVWLAARLLRPVVGLVTSSSNAVLGLFGDQTQFSESRLSPDELAQLVDEAARSGAVHPEAGQIAMRALDFGNVVVSDVMVPRTRIVAIPATASPEELRRLLLEDNHTQYPVYDGTLDDVVGVIATNDVLVLAWERALIVLQDLLRPAHFVPETMRAADALRELQREKLQMVIVVDERGGTAGIVTLKDLLEELVGEIFGRTEHSPPEHVRLQPDGSFVVPGNMAVRDANRELPFELPEGEDWSTVAGLTVALAGRIPVPGDRFHTDDGLPLEIVDASARRVRWVRVGPRSQRPPRS